jgi:hypothetical protein
LPADYSSEGKAGASSKPRRLSTSRRNDMKRIMGLLLISCIFFSCNYSETYTTIKIRIEITGTTQAHIIFNSSDYGYRDLPFIDEKLFYSYSGIPATPVYVQCYSTENINLNIYKNNILKYTENGMYINYNN